LFRFSIDIRACDAGLLAKHAVITHQTEVERFAQRRLIGNDDLVLVVLQRQVHRDGALFLPGKRLVEIVVASDQSTMDVTIVKGSFGKASIVLLKDGRNVRSASASSRSLASCDNHAPSSSIGRLVARCRRCMARPFVASLHPR